MYYEQTYFKRNLNGKWIKKSSKPYYCNMPYGKWLMSVQHDKKDGIRTYISSSPTKTGLNMKVDKATTYFKGNKEKVVYRLITTSNKLPKSYKCK